MNRSVMPAGSARFTTGVADAVYTPTTSAVAARKIPIVFLEGGDRTAENDPEQLGLNHILGEICDVGGYSIVQPSVPIGSTAAFGSPGAVARMNAAIAWGRANLGMTNDPALFFGASNGWVCSIIYARQYPVTGVIGLLPVTAALWVYENDIDGFRDDIDIAWGSSYPSVYPPDLFSPFDDVDNYPNLLGKVQMWVSSNDYLGAGEQYAFGAQIGAEMHTVGGYGHLGLLTDASFMGDHMDPDRVLEFINECVDAL